MQTLQFRNLWRVCLLAIAVALGAPGAAATERWKLATSSGTTVATLKIAKQSIKLNHYAEDEPTVLTARVGKADRAYDARGQGPKFTASAEPATFRLKSDTGALLWKVTKKDNRILMSRTENGAPVVELRMKSPTRAEVSMNGSLLGRVKFYPKKSQIKLKSAANRTLYRSRSNRMAMGFGTILLEDLNADERYVLWAELMERGW